MRRCRRGSAVNPHMTYAKHEAWFWSQYTNALWCAGCDADVPETADEANAAGWVIDHDGAPDGHGDTAHCAVCYRNRCAL